MSKKLDLCAVRVYILQAPRHACKRSTQKDREKGPLATIRALHKKHNNGLAPQDVDWTSYRPLTFRPLPNWIQQKINHIAPNTCNKK